MSYIRYFPLIVLLLFGCKKNELIDKVTVVEAPPVVLVSGSYKGKVLDENNQPVAGAKVTVYQAITFTDQNGLFQFNNIKAPKGSALVRVEKNGFFLGSAMSGSKSGSQQYVRVTMLQKGTPQTVNAQSGGTLTWTGGLKLKVPANGFLRPDGSTYVGQASVAARWLDPSNPDLGAIMPGALMARDASGAEKVLATFGMVALELKSTSGESLTLKKDDAAQIEVPIPAALDANAPADIPLWYFDLDQERWLLQGTCHHSSNGTYICGCGGCGTGYINCDVALEPICLSGTIYQSDSIPALYTKIIVEDLTDNFIYWGYTDINGFFCGSVPKGAPLKITIKDLCDNILYEANIGPYSMDFNLGNIYLTQNLQQYFIHVSGLMNDCSGAPVAVGQVAVQYPGKIRLFPLTTPGVIGFDMALNCIEFPELQLTGYDLTTFKATSTVLHSDDSNVDLGTLTACSDPGDFIHITSDGTQYNAAPTRFYLKTNVTTHWMVLEGLTTGGLFSIEMRQYTGVGQYLVNAFFTLTDNPNAPSYPNLTSSSPDITVTVSADDGQFITGTITGTAYDGLNVPHTINGDFKVKKEL